MKRKNCFILIICLIVLSGVCFGTKMSSVVYADGDTAPGDIVQNTSIGGIQDENLYTALINLYKISNPEYQSQYVFSEMFATATSLNLSGKNITSLSGIECLTMNNIESIDLSNNNIESISTSTFSNMSNIKNINLANNNISSFSATNISLDTLNLNNNKLTTIDLNIVKSTSTVYLSKNNFTKVADIKNKPTNTLVYALNNQFNVVPDDISNIFVGLYGISDELTNGNKIYYKKCNIESLTTIISRDGTEIEIINDDEVTSTQEFVLDVNNYTISFRFGDDNAYILNDDFRSIYSTINFSIKPNMPTYTLTYKGKTYDSIDFKINGAVTINGFCDDDCELWICGDGENWENVRSLEVIKGGTYSIQLKTVQNGIESEILYVFIRCSKNPYIPDFVGFIIILFVAGTFALVIYIIAKKSNVILPKSDAPKKKRKFRFWKWKSKNKDE